MPLAYITSHVKMRSARYRRHKIIVGYNSLVRANLLDPREDLDDSEVGLTYRTPTELESFEM